MKKGKAESFVPEVGKVPEGYREVLGPAAALGAELAGVLSALGASVVMNLTADLSVVRPFQRLLTALLGPVL